MACHWKALLPPRKMSKLVPLVRSEPRTPPMPTPPPTVNFHGVAQRNVVHQVDHVGGDLVAAGGATSRRRSASHAG